MSCPNCGNSLTKTDQGVSCSGCLEQFLVTDKGQLDFRLKKKKIYPFQFELGTSLLPDDGFDFDLLQKNDSPQLDFSKVKIPYHFTDELISYFPKAKEKDSLVLDLGCGEKIHKEICEYAGFEYVGIDYDSKIAPLLGDGQALPFKDESFELVILMNVLEHIRYPFVMMNEINRVLKPNGQFIGAVSYLEPFHMDSYYHHTHLGTFNSLQTAGFDIKYLSPNSHWHVLMSLTDMGALFPKLPSLISKLFVMPLYFLHRIWWKAGFLLTHSETASEKTRLLRTAGSFFFIASKGKKD